MLEVYEEKVHRPQLTACISYFDECKYEAFVNFDQMIGSHKTGYANKKVTKGLAQLIDKQGAPYMVATVIKVKKTVGRGDHLVILEIEAPATH